MFCFITGIVFMKKIFANALIRGQVVIRVELG